MKNMKKLIMPLTCKLYCIKYSFPFPIILLHFFWGGYISHRVFLLPNYSPPLWVNSYHMVDGDPSEPISVYLKCLDILFSEVLEKKLSMN